MNHIKFAKIYCDGCSTFTCADEDGTLWKCTEKCKRYQDYIDKNEK